MPNDTTAISVEHPRTVLRREAFWTWCRVAALSFGGPAGQIAVMHRIIVDEKKWISEARFLHALNFCMLLPGPEAQQLATYIGWLLHGTSGALIAGGLFILPGFLSILLLSIVYAHSEQSHVIQALFFGLKPAVVAIVVEALLRMGRRVLKNNVMLGLAGLSFIAIFCFGVPFPIIIVVAGIIGLIGDRLWPARFRVLPRHRVDESTDAAELIAGHQSADLRRALVVSAVCLTLWFGPLVLVGLALGTDSVYFQEGTFFSKAAVVTFGGAYSVLAYVAQQAVDRFGWLRPGEMLDGLGLAETTPGPLIMVVQFVAFLGAYRHPGPFTPMIAGILGSVITTWVTFAPCFFWILLGAPYVERLRGIPLIQSMLSAMTATVVGVILNLTIWFSLHTLFRETTRLQWFGGNIPWPVWPSVNLPECLLAAFACLLMFYWKRGLGLTLGLSAGLGVIWYAATSIR